MKKHHLGVTCIGITALALAVMVASTFMAGHDALLHKKITLVTALISISAVVLAAIAYVREKDAPIFLTAVVLGLVTIIWQYLVIGIIVAILVIALIVYLLDIDWPWSA
ncbi:MAG TPA: hypothetical protein VG347_18365 [Verrucomicrobiae bacterium]|nr:hypothetical protein [Verrucomicrobiae bacterium]